MTLFECFKQHPCRYTTPNEIKVFNHYDQIFEAIYGHIHRIYFTINMNPKFAKRDFFNKLNILDEASKLFFEYLDDQNDSNEKIKENCDQLFSSLNQKFFKADKAVIHDFLQMINKITIYRPINSNLNFKFNEFFDHLATTKGLCFTVRTFSHAELIDIFKTNKYILSLLIDNSMISIEELIKFIKNLSNNDDMNKGIIHFFLPEIFEYSINHDKELPKRILKNFDLENLYKDMTNSPESLNNFMQTPKLYRSPAKILQTIIENDINSFINYVSITNFNLKRPIETSPFETNYYINNAHDIGLFEYSMIFGALDIYKHILFNNEFSKNTSSKPSKYAIIGGNNDIIHSVERDTCEDYDSESLIASIECQYDEIYSYLKSNYDINLNLAEEFQKTLESFNFIHLNSFLKENESFLDEICENESILKYINSIPCILIFKYVLSLPNININQKGKDFILNSKKVLSIYLSYTSSSCFIVR